MARLLVVEDDEGERAADLGPIVVDVVAKPFTLNGIRARVQQALALLPRALTATRPKPFRPPRTKLNLRLRLPDACGRRPPHWSMLR